MEPFSPAHVATLDNFKQQLVCQGSPKYTRSDSDLETGLVILFAPNSESQDNPRQVQLSELTYYHPSE
ncbi:hypothetical protein TNCV_1524651 [Trichonephila clavipes]|nr:hypothetical protein TNCV_1524651 [Trichonephila clavipes]